MSKRRFEMYQYRQVLLRMRQGDSDREIARSRLMGRPKCAAVRSVAAARGWLFRTDTIVPFVRVQHIDVGQGPIERWFGLSHLIVHTSGTHNSTVTLPGLPSDRAAAMRETIRRHIQTDFA